MEVEANKAELTNLEMIEKLTGSEELTTLIKNSNEANWKSKIGGEVKQFYTPFDDAIEKHLGIPKSENTKTSTHYEGFIKELAEAQKELKVLKSSKGEASEAQTKLWNDKFSKLKSELETAKTALDSEKTNGFKNNVNNQLDTYLVGKTFKPSYSEDDIATLVAAKKAKIISNTKTLDNGKVAVINPKDGKFYMDTLGEPLTPQQVAGLEFSTMFHSAKKGGNTPDAETASIEGDVLAIDMNNIKTRGQFYDAFNIKMGPKGLASHSEEFNKIQTATMAHYKISSLPLS